MKQLNVLFTEVQHLQVSDLTDRLTNNASDIARAALYLGLNQIKVLAARDKVKAEELVAISNLKAK